MATLTNMITKHSNLSLVTLNAEGHAKTCNYWYLIQERCGPHTAFTSRASMLLWLIEHGLGLTAEIPEHGTWSWQNLTGSYTKESHYGKTATEAFDAIPAGSFLPCRVMDNANWTEGKITTDDTGHRTEHFLNCNENRHNFDYAASRALVG